MTSPASTACRSRRAADCESQHGRRRPPALPFTCHPNRAPPRWPKATSTTSESFSAEHEMRRNIGTAPRTGRQPSQSLLIAPADRCRPKGSKKATSGRPLSPPPRFVAAGQPDHHLGVGGASKRQRLALRPQNSTDAEIVVELTGSWCDYRLYFVWQEDLGRGLLLLPVRRAHTPRTSGAGARSLAGAHQREKLWLEAQLRPLRGGTGVPMFRHTLLRARDGPRLGRTVRGYVVDISLQRMRALLPGLQFVLWGGKTPEEALAAAMLETATARPEVS